MLAPLAIGTARLAAERTTGRGDTSLAIERLAPQPVARRIGIDEGACG
jgi:hypothetical protein